MNPSNIEWCTHTWNPVTGCTKISDGCAHCYAEVMAKTRLRGRAGYPADEPFRVTLHPDRLRNPLRHKRPAIVFMGSMGDLFHNKVPDEFLDRVFAIVALAEHHRFLALTKRSARLRTYFSDPDLSRRLYNAANEYRGSRTFWQPEVPLPNLGLGVTVETVAQEHRQVDLGQTPAAFRFLSCEPLLGIKSFYPGANTLSPDWIVAGPETGPLARPCDPVVAATLQRVAEINSIPFLWKGAARAGFPTSKARPAWLTAFANSPWKDAVE